MRRSLVMGSLSEHVAALAEPGFGDVVALGGVAAEASNALGVGALVVGAFVALAAFAVRLVAMEPWQFAGVVTAGAGWCAARGRMQLMAAGAATRERRVVLLGFHAVTARARGLAGQRALVRLVAGQASLVCSHERLLLLGMTTVAGQLRFARRAGVRLVAADTVGVSGAWVHLLVAAGARLRGVVSRMHVARVAAVAAALGMTAVRLRQRELRLVAVLADLRPRRMSEGVRLVTIHASGLAAVSCVWAAILVRLSMTTCARLCAHELHAVVHLVAAEAAATCLRWMARRDARMTGLASGIASRCWRVRVVTARAVGMRLAALLAEHVLILVTVAAALHLIAIEAVRHVAVRALLVRFGRQGVWLGVATTAAKSGNLTRLMRAVTL